MRRHLGVNVAQPHPFFLPCDPLKPTKISPLLLLHHHLLVLVLVLVLLLLPLFLLSCSSFPPALPSLLHPLLVLLPSPFSLPLAALVLTHESSYRRLQPRGSGAGDAVDDLPASPSLSFLLVESWGPVEVGEEEQRVEGKAHSPCPLNQRSTEQGMEQVPQTSSREAWREEEEEGGEEG